MKLYVEDVVPEYFTVDIDKDLYKELKNFRISFTQKDQSYIDFFGGTLTGTIPIRFSEKDDNELMMEILHINKKYLEQDILKCEGFGKNLKTASNPVYVALFYVMHKFNTNKSLDQKTRIDAVTETFLIISYKMLCSIISYYFKYSTDINTARAAYERMSGHFLLKRLNSWQEVLEYRAKDVIEKPPGINYKKTLKFNAENVISVVPDIKNRLNDMIKNYYSVLTTVKDQNEKIGTSSLLVENEDGVNIKDCVNSRYNYISYLISIHKRPNDFIRFDVVDLVVSMFDSVNSKNLIQLCKYFSDGEIKETEKLIENTILKEIEIITKKGYVSDYIKDIIPISAILKGSLSSSRISDSALLKLRNEYMKNIKRLFKSNNNRFISVMSTAMMLYLFFRAVFNDK